MLFQIFKLHKIRFPENGIKLYRADLEKQLPRANSGREGSSWKIMPYV